MRNIILIVLVFAALLFGQSMASILNTWAAERQTPPATRPTNYTPEQVEQILAENRALKNELAAVKRKLEIATRQPAALDPSPPVFRSLRYPPTMPSAQPAQRPLTRPTTQAEPVAISGG
jgi:hypothetical protein